MDHRERVGVVDGDVQFLQKLCQPLIRRGWEVVSFTNGSDALQYLESRSTVDVLVTNLELPDQEGLSFLENIHRRWGELPIISLANPSGLDSAPVSVQRGALSFLVKPFSPEELLADLRRIQAARRNRSQSEYRPLCGLVGRHPLMLELFKTIRNISTLPLTTSVLIQGESGVGKELVARAIHRLGSNSKESFIGLNCGSFHRTLLDDQLFGHVRGAFTGANETKKGVFGAAEGGTLFLDEITEMDPDLQVKLLRAIQEREVYPLGSDKPVPWTARLIVATNRNIDQEVEQGAFRRDLFYRVNVIRLHVPPLRDRVEDIPLLAEHFLREVAGEGGHKRLSKEALDLLTGYRYPGNIRELKNALERACALGSESVIGVDDLPDEFRDIKREAFKPLADLEREHILQALRLAGGKKVQAARYLKVDRNRLYRMIRKHRIYPHEL